MTTKKRANGEGSIYQRKDGYWIATTRHQGKLHAFSGKLRTDALGKRKKWLKDRENGVQVTAGKWLLGDWLAYWLDRKKPRYDTLGNKTEGIEPTTWEKYESRIRLYINPHVGHLRLTVEDASPERLERWQTGLADSGVSAEIRRQCLIVLSQALDFAVLRRLLAYNTASGKQIVRPIPAKPRPVQTRPDDIARLLQTVRGDPLEVVVWLALGAGLRRAEVAGLTWADIEYTTDGGAVIHAHTRVNRLTRRAADLLGLPSSRLERSGLKAEDERFVPIGSLVTGVLQRHHAQQLGQRLTGSVATTSIGTPIEPDAITKYLAEVRDRAGLHTRTFHQLRHAFVTFLERLGTTDHTRMALAGHKTAAMSSHYTHVMDPAKTEAAQALDGYLRELLG